MHLDVYLPLKQQHATGTGVCEYVHVNMCFQTSSMSRLNVTDHVLYQNIIWHAWKVGHGINLDNYVNLFIFFNKLSSHIQWEQLSKTTNYLTVEVNIVKYLFF